MHINNCSLILITKQEKANDANAFSTVIVLKDSGGFKKVLKLYISIVCVAHDKSHNLAVWKQPLLNFIHFKLFMEP